MKTSQNDLTRSALPRAQASAAVLRLHRARAVVRTRNSPISASPVHHRGGRAEERSRC